MHVHAANLYLRVRRSALSCRCAVGCALVGLLVFASWGWLKNVPVHFFPRLVLPYCVACTDGQEPYIATTATEPPFLIRTMWPQKERVSHMKIHWAGMWEQDTYDQVQLHLHGQCARRGRGHHGSPPAIKFVDIGSNIGFFSLAALSMGCGTLSVDALGINIGHLRSSIELNDIAAGTGRTLQAFIQAKESKPVNYAWGGDSRTRYDTNIPSTTIDALFEKYKLDSVRFVKIDIENNVVGALKGAWKTIEARRVAAWQIEIWDCPIGGVCGNNEDVKMKENVQKIIGMGYHAEVIGPWCVILTSKGAECKFKTKENAGKLYDTLFSIDGIGFADIVFYANV